MKKIRKILLSTMMLSALLISGCDSSLTPSSSTGSLDPQYQIFLKAKESGFGGTYEEWLESIKGADGVNGRSIVLELKDGYVCWKYEGDTDVTKLIAISELVGEAGLNGVDGATWVTGNTAPTAEEGKDGDLHLNLVTFAVSLKINGTWTSVGTIKGEAGEKGDKGDKGDAGKDGTNGENGAAGDKGDKGEKGDAGKGIAKIEKTSTDGLVDTYTITYTDETKSTFYVVNGKDGIDGENGQDGQKGEDGTDGKDGATWITGNIAPSAEEGKEGDFYLNLLTFEVSVKLNGTWTSIGTIKGETGQKGDKGEDGKDGTNGENGAAGEKGDKGDTGQKGEDGTNGKDGATWITGNIAPSIDKGKDGDLYLNLTTFEVFIKVDGAWSLVGTIKGEDGKDGAAAEVKEYNVTFNLDGGVMPENYTDILTVKEGSTLSLPVPTKEGYVFNGWFTGMTANDGQFYSFTPVFSDLNLIAKWSVESITVTIFDEWTGNQMTVEVPKDMIIGDYTFSDSEPRFVYKAYSDHTGEPVDLNSTFVDGEKYRLSSLSLYEAINQIISELRDQHQEVLEKFELHGQFDKYLRENAESLSCSNYLDFKKQMTELAETFIAENTSVEAYVITLVNELENLALVTRLYATADENMAIDAAIEEAKNKLNSFASIAEIDACYESNYRYMDFSTLINPTDEMLGFGNAKILVVQQYLNMYSNIMRAFINDEGIAAFQQHMESLGNELVRASSMELLLKMIEDDTLYLAESYGSGIDEKYLFNALRDALYNMEQDKETLKSSTLDIVFVKLNAYYDNSILMIQNEINTNSITESINLLDYLILWGSLVGANCDLSNEYYLYNYMASNNKFDLLNYSTEDGQLAMYEVLENYLLENPLVTVPMYEGDNYGYVMNEYEAACVLNINSEAVVSDLQSSADKWSTVVKYSQVTPEDQTEHDNRLQAVMNVKNYSDYKTALNELNSFVDMAYDVCVSNNSALGLLCDWSDFKDNNSKYDYSEYDIVLNTIVDHLVDINGNNSYLVDLYTQHLQNNIMFGGYFEDVFIKMSLQFTGAFESALRDYNWDVYMQYEDQLVSYSVRIQSLQGTEDKGIDIILEMIDFIINEVEANM